MTKRNSVKPNENKVLIITDLFPPNGGPGVKRIMQFIKYLIPLGWKSVVLTHKYCFMGYDEKSLRLIPKCTKIYRTFSLEPLVRKTSRTVSDIDKNNIIKRTDYFKKIFRHTKKSIGAPDTGMFWLPFAVLKSFKIMDFEKCQVVFATGPAYSNFVIGLIITLIFRKPLIVDFRDAWIGNPEGKDDSKIKNIINKFFEKTVIRNSRFVIPNTEGVKDAFIKRYPLEDPSKFVVIPNGFDRDDLMQADFSNVSLDIDKFNVVHTGTLGGFRNPKSLLVAIRELINEQKMEPKDLRIYLVGLFRALNDGRNIDDYIKEFGLQEQVIKVGFVSRQEAISYNIHSDLLLLIIGVTPLKYISTYGLSGKVYDYILTGKPIFSMAQKGCATYNLLKKYNIGVIASPSDVLDIKIKFNKLYKSWKYGNLKRNYDSKSIEDHNMEKLTKKLSDLLNYCLIG